MKRDWYLKLAEPGSVLPIATDLALRECEDPEAVLLDGPALGEVFIAAARGFGSPLALPTMDLELEKLHLAAALGVPEAEARTFHFERPPDEAALRKAREAGGALSARMRAMAGAIAKVAETQDLAPVGMCIGPFSLMTKLVADPILPLALAGEGLTGEDDDGIRLVEGALEIAEAIVGAYVDAQMDAGARALFVAEPAANVVYVSPRQMEAGSDVFERFAIAPNRRIRDRLAARGVDLLFHCCGELTAAMVERFGSLNPAILSLGSSRDLSEDAALVPSDVVLFGNLPSKRLYSDAEITVDEVREQSRSLLKRMRLTGHPFVLGTECDVLSVPGRHATIRAKVEAMVECGCAESHSAEAARTAS